MGNANNNPELNKNFVALIGSLNGLSYEAASILLDAAQHRIKTISKIDVIPEEHSLFVQKHKTAESEQ